MYGGRFLWPIEQMDSVLRTFREATETAPEQLSTWFHVYQFPPLPEVPEPIRGKAFASVAVAYIGTREEAEPHLAAYRAIPGMVMDLVGEVPLSALGSIADEPTDPMPGMQRSYLLDDLDDDAITALVATVGPGSGSPLTIVQIRHFGGAFAADREGRGSHGRGDRALQRVRARRPRRTRAGRADRDVLRPRRRRRGPRRERSDAAELHGVRRRPGQVVDPRHPRAAGRGQAALRPAADDPQQPARSAPDQGHTGQG